jgi:hypothetical protein
MMNDFGAWDRYKRNSKIQKHSNFRFGLDVKIPSSWTVACFDWQITNEGFEYWESINRKWNHIIRHNQ